MICYLSLDSSLDLGGLLYRIGEVLVAVLGDQNVVLDAETNVLVPSVTRFFGTGLKLTGHHQHPSTCPARLRQCTCCERGPASKVG